MKQYYIYFTKHFHWRSTSRGTRYHRWLNAGQKHFSSLSEDSRATGTVLGCWLFLISIWIHTLMLKNNVLQCIYHISYCILLWESDSSVHSWKVCFCMSLEGYFKKHFAIWSLTLQHNRCMCISVMGHQVSRHLKDTTCDHSRVFEVFNVWSF